MTEITLLASKVILQVTCQSVAVKGEQYVSCMPSANCFSVTSYFAQVLPIYDLQYNVKHVRTNCSACWIHGWQIRKQKHTFSVAATAAAQRDTFPSVNTAYQSEGSFTFTHLGRPAELDPPQLRPWPVAFTFRGIFLPSRSSSNSCFFHVYISRKSHEKVPVKAAANFPPNSFESRDCRHTHWAYTVYLQMSQTKCTTST
jgi:hypothetical protein